MLFSNVCCTLFAFFLLLPFSLSLLLQMSQISSNLNPAKVDIPLVERSQELGEVVFRELCAALVGDVEPSQHFLNCLDTLGEKREKWDKRSKSVRRGVREEG